MYTLIMAYTLVFGAWLGVFWADIPVLIKSWNGADYSHCYLVLPLVGYMIWTSRQRIAGSLGGSPLLGYVVCLLAFLFALVGRLGSLSFFVQVGMWTSLCGAVLVATGHKALKSLWMPFLIGYFMIPLPQFLNRLVGLKLRLISSVLSEKILQLLHIPVYRDGNVIDLGVIQLQVVDACSGLRYLWPSLLMALLVGWFFMRKPWKKVALICCAVPVTIFSNAFRIALTGVLTKFIDPSLAEGFFHDFSGWLVYVLSLGVLGICAHLLNRGDTPVTDKERIATPFSPERLGAWWYGLVLVVLFAGMYAGQTYLLHRQETLHRQAFTSFPAQLGAWRATRNVLSKPVLKSLGSDDYYNGYFRNTETGDVIYVLVTWYDRQTASHAAHAPTSCLVGGGWDIDKKGILPSLSGQNRRFPVTQMILTKGGRPLISNFWFLQRGRVVVSEWMNKWYLLVDAVSEQRTDGALVRLEMPVRPGQSVEGSQAVLDGFAAQLREALSPHLPEGY